MKKSKARKPAPRSKPSAMELELLDDKRTLARQAKLRRDVARMARSVERQTNAADRALDELHQYLTNRAKQRSPRSRATRAAAPETTRADNGGAADQVGYVDEFPGV